MTAMLLKRPLSLRTQSHQRVIIPYLDRRYHIATKGIVLLYSIMSGKTSRLSSVTSSQEEQQTALYAHLRVVQIHEATGLFAEFKYFCKQDTFLCIQPKTLPFCFFQQISVLAVCTRFSCLTTNAVSLAKKSTVTVIYDGNMLTSRCDSFEERDCHVLNSRICCVWKADNNKTLLACMSTKQVLQHCAMGNLFFLLV